MKKSELIKLLEQIEGDPDIVVWNEESNNYRELEPEIEPIQLVRLSFDSYVQFIEEERKLERNDPFYVLTGSERRQIRSWYDKHPQWEINPWVSTDDIDKHVYTAKTSYMIKPTHDKQKEIDPFTTKIR